MKTPRRSLALGLVALAAPALPRAQAQPWALRGLPGAMAWAVPDAGSTTHAEIAQIADALFRAHGVRVRLQPSGTNTGRIAPLRERRTSHAWLANELYLAVEGLDEYATAEWGPQDFRVLLGRRNAFSVVATRESGITRPEQLRGKRLAWVRSNASVNIKVEPVLAFAGLTLADVELVRFPSYLASLRAVLEGRADCAGALPGTPLLEELAASPAGLSWVQLDPANTDGWAAARRVLRFAEPMVETLGAGLSETNPAAMLGFRFPMLTVNADAPEAEVHALMRAIHEAFAMFKLASPVMPRWATHEAGAPPMDAAFHPGAVRFLRECGFWTVGAEAWQAGMLRRHAALRAAWADFLPGARQLPAEQLATQWAARRGVALAGTG
jgi:uncharacterized protein